MNPHETGKDFNGTELKLGDKVAFISPYVKSLVKGTVTGFTPKMIEIEWVPAFSWNRTGKPEKILRNISWVTKVPNDSNTQSNY
jgi:hypothetical protein